ncbi:MAG: glycogen/starch/alpha-glucan phosphorylase [Lachnospiraceae bacterium]|nr:glycogen/starch/alpha-glucan phosphorylase [Lachnospiraceae bacterium]
MQTNLQRDVLVMNLDKQFETMCDQMFHKKITECDNHEIYVVLLNLVKELTLVTERLDGEKKVYYISAEFLIGKLLSNNLINLGIYDKVKDLLEQNGKNLAEIEEIEPEPSLGNGGLGRLAACFMDSVSTLGIPGEGIGLNYHYGLFHQKFEDHLQTAEKDNWIEPQSWLKKTDIIFPVEFGADKKKVKARLYNLDVVGYANGVNKLRLFDLDTVDESLVKSGITFDKEAIDKNLTLFLYPDDSDEAGNKLRIYQQYFMVSAAAQLILYEMHENKYDLRRLYDFAAIQINDTHPTMIIPELIRLMVAEKAFPLDEAIEVVTKTCAYTNHTILAEALEKWPLKYLEEIVPQLVPIIKELDKRAKAKYKDEAVAIIDKDDFVHMAHIDIHYGHSVNGVAAIHTEILKNTELHAFYKIYPEKFNNKTNGITFRRWLLSCNHELADYLADKIGYGYKKNAQIMTKFLEYKEDETVLDQLDAIKTQKKKELADFIQKKEGITINPDSIYDIQVKRLHEYKRQQMNALYIIHKYLEIKKNVVKGLHPVRPVTYIFGAKAAPAYVTAKDIIHLLLVLQEIINNDPDVNQWMKIVMVENYNVTYAEKIIPACDISEQISLASKEASGTGNMKFMLNGAITLGTDDGANVEIHELVGDDNIYIFGAKASEVIKHYEKADYVSKEYYKKSNVIKEAVDFIIGKQTMAVGHAENLNRLYKELTEKDWFMTLLDLEDYIATKDKAIADYEDRAKWKRMMLVNIAHAGYFSADRTVWDYNNEIWHVPIQGNRSVTLSPKNRGMDGLGPQEEQENK